MEKIMLENVESKGMDYMDFLRNFIFLDIFTLEFNIYQL